MCFREIILVSLFQVFSILGETPPCPLHRGGIGPTPAGPSSPRLLSSCEAGNGRCIDTRCKDCIPGFVLEGLCEYSSGQWRKCCNECPRAVKCSVNGAGYFTTLYGLRYNFQEPGTYMLSQDCTGGTWHVAIVLETLPGGQGAVLASVEIVVGSVSVEIFQGGGPVAVNDGTVTLDSNPFTIDDVTITTFETAYYKAVMITFLGVTVIDIIDGRSVQVIPSTQYADKTCGLCGIISDKPSDFTTDATQLAIQDLLDQDFSGCPFYGNPLDVDHCKTMMAEVKDSCVRSVNSYTYLSSCAYANCLGGAARSQSVLYDYYMQCTKEKRGRCTQSGHTYYDTFDKTSFQIQGADTFVLAKDCIGNTWSIDVSHVAVDTYTEVEKVTITFATSVIQLVVTGKMVVVDGTVVGLPFNSGQTSIYLQGNLVTVAALEGALIVSFNFNQLVVVDVSSTYYEKTCGLCGVWNGDVSDDNPVRLRVRRSTNGIPEGFTPIPNPTGCPPSEITQAKLFCENEFDDALDDDCNICYTPERLARCMYEYCLGGTPTLCDHAEEFYQDCFLKGGSKPSIPDFCKTTTTTTTTTTTATTAPQNTTTERPLPASSKCHARGDPHYKNFEGIHFNFQGNGTFLHAGACNGSWSVFTELQHIRRRATVVHSIDVEVGDITVEMSNTFVVKINSVTVENFPHVCGDVLVRKNKKKDFTIKFLGVVVIYRKRFVRVFVNTDWYNKTCGLCGRWNEDTSDDYDDIPEITEYDDCTTVPADVVAYCVNIITQVAEAGCPTDEIDIQEFREDCEFDHCICGEECSAETVAELMEDCFPPRVAECYVYAHTFYQPFDSNSDSYEMHGACKYKLAANDCNGGENTYGVYVIHQANTDSVTSIAKIDIEVNGVVVSFLRNLNAVEIDGDPIDLTNPHNGVGFVLSRSGNIVTYEDSIIQVVYNFNQMIRVVVNEQSFNKTCGLCGTWDDDITQEMSYKQDPGIAHYDNVLNNACTRIENPDRCSDIGGSVDNLPDDLITLCEKIARKTGCEDLGGNVVEQICLKEACLCDEECACLVSRDTRDYCFSITGLQQLSKTIGKCQAPDPTTSPPPTTTTPLPPTVDERASCRQSYNTFYSTFDGVNYQLQGVCTYTLAADASGSWKIQVQHQDENQYTTVKKIIITTSTGEDVKIKAADRSVKVNAILENTWATDGYEGNGFTISVDGPFIKWEDDAGVAFRYDFEQLLIVQLNDEWQGRVNGLCGNFDSDRSQERSMKRNLQDTHNEYREGSCAYENTPGTCSGVGDISDNTASAENKCENFFNDLSCSEVRRDLESEKCAFSFCLCPDCLCAFMRSYRRQCYAQTASTQYLNDLPNCSGEHAKVGL